MPIKAEPAFCIIVLTSAKSTLMMPGIVIRSEIPSTACLKTSSQIWKAERKVVSLPTMLNRRSLGMTIIASTASLRFISPCSASLDRWAPSNPKGLVTTAIVRMPCSLAILATTGRAPVAVPPPCPPETKSHIGAFDAFLDCFFGFFGGFLAHFRIHSSPKPLVMFCRCGFSCQPCCGGAFGHPCPQ